MEPQTPQPTPIQRKGSARPLLIGLGVVVVFGGLFAVGFVPRLHQRAALNAAASDARAELPTVTVAKVIKAPERSTLDLPGEIKPFQEAAVLARSTGYLKRRLVDIGDRVHTGQLLAEIESPELDRELDQARAALAQAEANLAKAHTDYALARTTAGRWQALRKDGSVAQQDADEKAAAFQAQASTVASVQAGVRASRKNVQRLETLSRYERVQAPFSGTITARGADPGALIGAGAGAASSSLFKLVQLDRLRIDINVPEPFAPTITRDQTVQVTVRELGKPFAGRVLRTAGALDPATRTLLAEIELRNDGHLMPGMYARVKLDAQRATSAVQVPGNALVTRAKGSAVAVVSPAGVVRYQRVETGPDDGQLVEIVSGLKVGESVIIGPSDDIKDGTKVKTVALPNP